jgi:hypothetical protein
VKMAEAARQKAVVEKIENLGGLVWYDYQFDAAGNEVPGAEPPGDPWLRWLLGDDLFTNVTKLCVRQFTDPELGQLNALSQLQWLDLMESEVTDAGLGCLKSLSQLNTLNLRTTKVTDVGLEHVKGLRWLQGLDLSDTNVTDAGLESLRGLTRLRDLRLFGTKVTDAGIAGLQKALPNCRIQRR